jgi:hypothetical protein
LEHVSDIDAAIAALKSLTERWLVVSVPCSYPRHDCPIDNLWRPNPQQLADRLLAHGFTILEVYQTSPETFCGVPDASAVLAVAEKR